MLAERVCSIFSVDTGKGTRPGRRGSWARYAILLFLAAAIACSAESHENDDREAPGGSGDSSAGAGGSPLDWTPPEDWVRPENPVQAVLTDCKAGHYVGEFRGDYFPGAFFYIPITVAAVETNGLPGLEFWLEQKDGGCESSDEFCYNYEIRDGFIRGFADPTASDASSDQASLIPISVPFEIELQGKLDCTARHGEFVLANGWYDWATLLYTFEGTATGTYDATDASFFDGLWEVGETGVKHPDPNAPPPPQPLPPPPGTIAGGSGTWNAQWVDW